MERLDELQEKYDLELDRILKEIEEKKAKTVLLQFPDGLKHYALDVVDYLEEKSKAEFYIFLGSCFGACDTPESDANLVVQFGHAPW